MTSARQIFTPGSAFPNDLVILRHGETTWARSSRIEGQFDRPVLTLRGRLQSRHAGEVIARTLGGGPAVVYASDLRRARQSARIVAERIGAPLFFDERLRDRDLGMLEGAPSSLFHRSFTGIDEGLVVDPKAAPPGGESLHELWTRVSSFLDDAAQRELHRPGSVVVVAHNDSLQALMAIVTGQSLTGLEWEPVRPGQVMRLHHDTMSPSVEHATA